jgi:hypothetical protein
MGNKVPNPTFSICSTTLQDPRGMPEETAGAARVSIIGCNLDAVKTDNAVVSCEA